MIKETLIHIIICTSILCVLSLSCGAQSVLNIENCRQKALLNNKQLGIARLVQKQALVEQKAVSSSQLGRVSAEFGNLFIPGVDDISMPGNFLPLAESRELAQAGEFSGTSNVWNPGLNLELGDINLSTLNLKAQMPVYAGGKIKTLKNIASTKVDITSSNYNLKESEILLRCDKGFYTVVALIEKTKVAREAYKMLSELEEQVNDMYNLGVAPLGEKLKVIVKKNEAELNIINSENGLKIARMNLNQIIGNSLNDNIALDFKLSEDFSLPDFSSDVESALKLRPELKMLSEKRKIKQLQEKIVKSEYLPKLGVELSKRYMHLNKIVEEGRWNTVAGINLSIPIFQWGEGVYKSRAAAFESLQTELELNDTEELVILDVNKARVLLEQCYKAILVAQKSVDEANNNLEESKISFENGLHNTTDLLIAQTEWQKAQSRLIESITNFEISRSGWLKAQGLLTAALSIE